MEQQNTRLRNAGFATFFFSGICANSAGVVVSLLQERYGFAYGMTGTLLSLMSVGLLFSASSRYVGCVPYMFLKICNLCDEAQGGSRSVWAAIAYRQN